jgi:hypothetical protein
LPIILSPRLRIPSSGGRCEGYWALAALMVLHNYWIKRAGGTTAARRFFRQEPEDLFDWLLQRFPELPRPDAHANRPPDRLRAPSN